MTTLLTRLALVIALLWFGSGTTLSACPICFRVEEGPVTDGIRAAVVVLIAVTSCVLTGFAVFIGKFVSRTKSS
jgi:hypothetical protein